MIRKRSDQKANYIESTAIKSETIAHNCIQIKDFICFIYLYSDNVHGNTPEGLNMPVNKKTFSKKIVENK